MCQVSFRKVLQHDSSIPRLLDKKRNCFRDDVV